jgi:hypothetical protein
MSQIRRYFILRHEALYIREYMTQDLRQHRNKSAMEKTYSFPRIYKIPIIKKYEITGKIIENINFFSIIRLVTLVMVLKLELIQSTACTRVSKRNQSHLIKDSFTEMRVI